MAGSYFIETLTKQMEEKIQEERERIQAGGRDDRSCIHRFCAETGRASRHTNGNVDSKRMNSSKIGVNKYVDEEEHDVELHEYDPTTQEKQVKNSNRSKRNEATRKYDAH